MTHSLKTHKLAFQAVWDGLKPFEYRKNDRDYKEGDDLILMEYDHESDTYSHRVIMTSVPFILYGGQYGISDGYCIMTLGNIIRFDPKEILK